MKPSFGTRLRELRQRAKLTGYALGQRARVSRSFISEIESGKKSPTWDVIVRLADALGIGVEEFAASK